MAYPLPLCVHVPHCAMQCQHCAVQSVLCVLQCRHHAVQSMCTTVSAPCPVHHAYRMLDGFSPAGMEVCTGAGTMSTTTHYATICLIIVHRPVWKSAPVSVPHLTHFLSSHTRRNSGQLLPPLVPCIFAFNFRVILA